MRRVSLAVACVLAAATVGLTACGSPSDESTPSASPTVPVGVSVEDDDLPEVEGEFAKSATLTFPLKPGATPPPSPTPTPEETAVDDAATPETGESPDAEADATADETSADGAATPGTDEPTDAEASPDADPAANETLADDGAAPDADASPDAATPEADSTTEDPATEDSATEDPATEDSATEDPTTEDPTTEDPTTEDPTTEDPAVEDPTTEDPAAEPPLEEGDVPTDEELTAESPTPSPSETPSPYIDPPETLQAKVIVEGDGEEVQPLDAVTVYYRGQVWGNNEPFDENYPLGSPTTMTLGRYPNVPIEGWGRGLVGKKVNSRVLLVIPPAEGYGIEGNEQAGIAADDVIVFVVDIVARFGEHDQAQADATPTGARTTVMVTGELAEEPTLSIPGDASPPEFVTTTVLATGTGEEIQDGDTAILQFKAIDWSGADAGNTWGDEGLGSYPQMISASLGEDAVSAFSGLVGVPVGSRVLVELPAMVDQYQGAVAIIDVVALTPRGEGLSTDLVVGDDASAGEGSDTETPTTEEADDDAASGDVDGSPAADEPSTPDPSGTAPSDTEDTTGSETTEPDNEGQ
ncbi:MAG: FKBP-type peptidyl-prolyl cis-trans isomerase [Bifidobacteriaceae bacterium]|nr:FKBP-type peptidyl-prolyl cis-trans isomerase [Bifidobacteriaceae bacterium]